MLLVQTADSDLLLDNQMLLDRLVVAEQILLDRLVVAEQILLDSLVVAEQFLWEGRKEIPLSLLYPEPAIFVPIPLLA